MRHGLRKGSWFYAIVQKGEHSADVFGNECAGQRLGPYVVSRIRKSKQGDITSIEAGDFAFKPWDWEFEQTKPRRIK